MAGIVPALETHDDIGTVGEPVDKLALAFVAPLSANYGYVCQDDCSGRRLLQRRSQAMRMLAGGTL